MTMHFKSNFLYTETFGFDIKTVKKLKTWLDRTGVEENPRTDARASAAFILQHLLTGWLITID
jgi:hypothetical protein